MPETVYVLNGPNLNLLGTREPDKYGTSTLAEVEALCRQTGERHGLAIVFHQSNHEGELVEWIHQAWREKAAGIVINPAAYTMTSVAILDALLATRLPTVEIHISNPHVREAFRQHSYISAAARGVICGFGIEGYALAITGLAALLRASRARTAAA
jgi:3-dehydroquinate dehydratase-2